MMSKRGVDWVDGQLVLQTRSLPLYYSLAAVLEATHISIFFSTV